MVKKRIYEGFLAHLSECKTEAQLFSPLTYALLKHPDCEESEDVRLDDIRQAAYKIGIKSVDYTVTQWILANRDAYDKDPAGFNCQALEQFGNGTVPTVEHKLFSSSELDGLALPPIRFIIPGLLPMGLGLIVAKPKVGKSWMMLDLCLSVSAGTPFLGYPVNRSGALYLALEDGKSRLQTRQRRVNGNLPFPSNLFFATEAPRIDEGLLEWLDSLLDENPDIHLIVIDTLAKVKSIKPMRANENIYAADYDFLGKLKKLADDHGICILVVHHTSKGNKSDSFDKVNGSTALMGAADFTFVLDDVDRERREATLNITGRDIECQELAIRLAPETMRWYMLGTSAEMEEQRRISAYECNPIVKTLREILQQSDGKWTGSSQKLNELGKHYTGQELASSSQALAKAIRELEPLLKERDCIRHEEKPHGSASKTHVFKMERTDNTPIFEECEQQGYT